PERAEAQERAESVAGGAVELLAEDVEVAAMAGGLLEHVAEDPPERGLAAPPAVDRGIVEAGHSGDRARLLARRPVPGADRRHRLVRADRPRILAQVGVHAGE